MPEPLEPTLSDDGVETHPAFGQIQVNRVTSSGAGKTLFDSETQHNNYIVIKISPATRRRSLNHDRVFSAGGPFVEVSMSEAQWASMVSSLNTSGTSCTIDYVNTEDRIQTGPQPAIPFAPRLALSMEETKAAADRMFSHAQEAFETYKANKNAANLRALEAALTNASPNVQFVARSLAEHAENVVQKAKADIEAMVDSRARQVGIDPHTLTLGMGNLGDHPALAAAPSNSTGSEDGEG